MATPVFEVYKFANFRHRNGSYYFDCGRDANGRRAWVRLGKDRDAALRRYAELTRANADEAVAVAKHLDKVYFAARRRAKVAGIDFHLTRDEYRRIISRSGLKCELTSIPFSMGWVGSARRRPFVPSLDRRDSALPYSVENCRLVLCAVNYALNEWGETVLRKIAAALVEVPTKNE
jgi:hypothetical protein